MIVERIRAQVVAVPLDIPLMTTLGPVEHSLYLTVEIEADGLSGVGYGWALTEAELRALKALVLLFGQSCVGRDPLERTEIRREIESSLRWTGRAGLGMFAMGVIDMCLWDLAGKARQEPLWRMLGGTQRPVPCYASGLFLSASRDEMLAEAAQYLEAGYSGVKMRVGAADSAEDVARVSEVLDLLAPAGVDLMVDAGLAWSGGEAVERALALSDLAIHWIEDPVDYHEGFGLDSLVEIRRQCPVPICAGEFLAGVLPFAEMIERSAAAYLNVDLLHVGGLTAWLEVVEMSVQAGLTPVTHMFPEVAVHIATTLDRPHAIEYVPGWSTKLFQDAETPSDGVLHPPDAPGLGVNYDHDKLEAWALGGAEEVSLASI